MKGMQDLIDMRLQGRVPSLLYVDLDVGRMPGEGHLQIGAKEPLYSLDLRGVQGLVVSVSGLDGKRVKAVAKACEEAGARRVLGNVCAERHENQFEVIEVTDTEGLFTWKK
jgi:glycine/D-amino acid oxidase-like deaminating enzyme